MSKQKVTPHKRSAGRPTRGLNVRKMVYVTALQNAELARAAVRYGSEANVVRLALDRFFLAEAVSLSNIGRDGNTQEAV